ncbi:661_t:CDS:2, partial [Racocetra persica]
LIIMKQKNAVTSGFYIMIKIDSTGIDPLANWDQVFGIFRGCLHGQANMGALQDHIIAQMNTSNSFKNPSIAHDYANIVGNNAVTQQIKNQFLRDLSSDLKDNTERISTEQPLADLFEILE